nr:hypothetical protein [uncultured Pseudomonas sp.]
MGSFLGTVKKVVWAALGVAGVALITHIVDHGTIPEWMQKLCSWVWALVAAISGWAWALYTAPLEMFLWEIILVMLLICAPVVLFLHRNAIEIARLQSHSDQLNEKLQKSEKREYELKTELKDRKLLAKNGAPFPDSKRSLTVDELQLMLHIATLEHDGVRVTQGSLSKVAKLSEENFFQTINSLRQSNHIVQIKSSLGARFQLTDLGRTYISKGIPKSFG